MRGIEDEGFEMNRRTQDGGEHQNFKNYKEKQEA